MRQNDPFPRSPSTNTLPPRAVQHNKTGDSCRAMFTEEDRNFVVKEARIDDTSNLEATWRERQVKHNLEQVELVVDTGGPRGLRGPPIPVPVAHQSLVRSSLSTRGFEGYLSQTLYILQVAHVVHITSIFQLGIARADNDDSRRRRFHRHRQPEEPRNRSQVHGKRPRGGQVRGEEVRGYKWT